MIGPAAGALLAETRRRPGRLLLTGLAVLVATVFAAGTLLLAETLRGYVADRTQQTPAGAAAVVLAEELAVPEPDGAALVAAVAGVPGVVEVVPAWTALLPVDGAGATTRWEIGSDPMLGPLTRLPAPVQGRVAAAPDEVVVGEGTAERTGLRPGASLTITPDAGPARTVTVTGVVEVPYDGVNTVIGTPEAVGSIGGVLSQIDVAAAPGTDPQALVAGVGAAVGAPQAVRTGDEQRLAEVESASRAVSSVLLGVGVFAGLAMVAAAVVVASTFRIVLTQRRTQLALLRCVGARRGQVVRAVLAEAAVSGLVAGALGVGAAVLLGYGVTGVLALLGPDSAPVLAVPWVGMLGCLLIAVLATVLAALAPALAAARIPPVAALGAAAAGESGAPRPGPRLLLAGALAAAAVAMAVYVVTGTEPQNVSEAALALLAASGMVLFAALVTAGPVLVRGLAATVGRVVAAFGRAPGRLATANAAQVPRRTAATVSVLTLGVGLTAGLLVALAATQERAESSIEALFPGDVAVTADDPAALADRLGAEPALVVVRADGTGVFLDAAPGVEPSAVRQAVDAAVDGLPGASVQFASDVRAELETMLFAMRAIGLALVGMTLLVAVVGVAVTLMLSVTERTRETGLLRAVGLSRRGVRATVAWEAALTGTGAALLGAVIGSAYGLLGARVLDLGDGLVPSAVVQLAALVVGVVVLAVLAAALPAARAGRVPPIRALQA
ncbi:ABC transporter permease [Pseudonocardia humida]|uniref:FtsX-like permease family protein n=1 Tax=Pseudonocardia humida TaxID=2800819 RepID=A0ABT1ACK1_9PSEU|nr:ABC transporter permease [Pseudonocardia humida]MCO1660648.1 FtsX-like permease family protein [Pseudonocardia humida]